jgi:cell division septal protein FtsQ
MSILKIRKCFFSKKLFYVISLSALLGIFISFAVSSLRDYPVNEILLFDSLGTNDNTKDINRVLTETKEQAWFGLDVKELEMKISNFSWVKNVVVTKPKLGVLAVKITEHKPIFRWASGYLISSEGVPFEVSDYLWEKYNFLPHIESSTKNLKVLSKINPVLSKFSQRILGKLERIRINSPEIIEVLFEKSTVIVAYDDAYTHLSRLKNWFEKLPEKLFNNIKRIDLRYNSGFAISEHGVE